VNKCNLEEAVFTSSFRSELWVREKDERRIDAACVLASGGEGKDDERRLSCRWREEGYEDGKVLGRRDEYVAE
jgi:hypothetical protein